MNLKQDTQQFTVIDLFSGAGGLTLGVEMAGFRIDIAIENEIYSARTYQKNHPNAKVINSDIRKIRKIQPGKFKEIIITYLSLMKLSSQSNI